MEITVRVEVQYLAPENAVLMDVLRMFRRPMWVRFMMRYISPRLKTSSPADKTVLKSLENEWLLPAAPATQSTEEKTKEDADDLSECVICMADSDADDETQRPRVDHVRLPCGHAFHFHCVQSWLHVRSTCPICRFQFRKAFAGTYAVHSLASTVLLGEEHRSRSREEVLGLSVEKQLVRAVVNVTLVRVVSEEKQKEYPCELTALVVHADGEAFSEHDVYPTAAQSVQDASVTMPVTGVRSRDACDVHDPELDEQQRQFKRLRRA